VDTCTRWHVSNWNVFSDMKSVNTCGLWHISSIFVTSIKMWHIRPKLLREIKTDWN
jgi:hypothetical protein